ncbi:EamA family transporter [Alphaproteobacteria bacterium HT1-32]|nr:EamA family transporter [Alphaproteobacteria bacterium HT1-32]
MTLPHLILILSINVIWGMMYVAGKLGVDQFEPLFFTGLRFALLTVCLLPFLRIVPGRMKRLLTFCLVMGVLHYTFIYYAIDHAENVGSIAILSKLSVPFSVILAIIFFGEHVGPWRVAGIGTAFMGVLVIGFDPVVFNNLDSVIMVLAAALMFSIAALIVKSLKDVNVFTINAWISAVSFGPLLGLSFLFEEGQINSLVTADWFDWSMLVYSAVLVSIFGHGGVYYLLQRYPVSLITPWLLLVPIIGVAGGILFLGDEMTWRLGIGGILTISGIAIVSLREAQKKAI